MTRNLIKKYLKKHRHEANNLHLIYSSHNIPQLPKKKKMFNSYPNSPPPPPKKKKKNHPNWYGKPRASVLRGKRWRGISTHLLVVVLWSSPRPAVRFEEEGFCPSPLGFFMPDGGVSFRGGSEGFLRLLIPDQGPYP